MAGMKNIGFLKSFLLYNNWHLNTEFEKGPSSGVESISITVHHRRFNKRKKYKVIKYTHQTQLSNKLSSFSRLKCQRPSPSKHCSVPKLNSKKTIKIHSSKSDTVVMKCNNPYEVKYVVNRISVHRLNPFYNPMTQTRLKVYRCQMNTKDESCCCSCNSDAMFEVMKSLYDCYKKKNCDHCNCILCGHLPREERRLGEERKSITRATVGVGAGAVQEKDMKKKKDKLKKAEKAMEGKTTAEKEKIMRDLVKQGVPLPEPKTASEKELVKKLKTEYGLPVEPKTPSEKKRLQMAEDAGLITPLSGKTPSRKEKILRKQAELGIPLPEGRTPSEKALIEKIKTTAKVPSAKIPSEKWRKAKAEGLLTPLEGKTPVQKEKILKGLAMQGLPLPEGKTDSERKLIDKVRGDVGLPPEPKSRSMKEQYNKALGAGLMVPLEGKSPSQKEKILQGLADMGIPLPAGRTPTEKALVEKVKARPRGISVLPPSEKMRRAKAAGLLTPLEGKTVPQKEQILRGLATQGIPLPEGKTSSEKKLIDKVRADMGLPPEPKTPSMREKYNKAADAGLMVPLEGKTLSQKEKILQGLADMGVPLPEGRTPSEKNIITKVKAGAQPPAEGVALSEKLRKAKAAGLLTPLEGKPPEHKENIMRGLAMQGLPLPEAKTSSEKIIADKVRADLGLPPEPKTSSEKAKYKKAVEAGLIVPLEGKSPSQKEKILRGQQDMGIPLPEGRTASEKALIQKIKAGERRKTKSRIGPPALPPEERKKLEEKSAKHVKEGSGPVDECICGLLTSESEREPTPAALPPGKITSQKLREAKAAGVLTPLAGKTQDQKEKILKELAKRGLPLPEGKTASEKQTIDKVIKDMGLPPEPKSKSMKEKYAKAQAAGIITPLEGKTPSQKEKLLRAQADMGLALPEGRTASEKALIAKVKAARAPSITTEKVRKAKEEGLLTPLKGKTLEQKEKILKGLAKSGLPLPEGKTPSEKALIRKIKTEAGVSELTPSQKVRKAKDAGLLTPLDGKTPVQKEKILRGRAAAGLPLPEGRTQSEKDLVKKIKGDTGYVTPTPSERMKRAKAAGLLTPLEGKTPSHKAKIIQDRLAAGLPPPVAKTPSEKEFIKKVTAATGAPPAKRTPSERRRQAKAAGLLTPLEGKTPEQKDKILRGLVKAGIPLPEPKTASDAALINKIRKETGLPQEPDTPSLKEKYRKAQEAGIITPLFNKSPSEKERALKKMHDAGIPLPEGRTPSEKAMVHRVKAGLESPKAKSPSERIQAAKAAGLLTPLEGKTPEQKQKILRGLAKAGVPLPEAYTASEKALIKKVRSELGLPPEPQTPSMKEKMRKAQAAGIITPLEGKTTSHKERILKKMAQAGVALPEGRTPSEKALVKKIKAETLPPAEARKLDEKTAKVMKEGKGPADECICGILTPESKKKEMPPKTASEKMRKAKAAGLLTPLKGKTPEEKEKILKGLAQQGLPLPVAETASDKKLVDKVRINLGLPPEPESASEKKRYENAVAAGKIVPLEGKSPSEKVKILKSQAAMGIPLPEGRTPSEKALIERVKNKMRPRIPSEKLRKAKEAGLLTPLEGKTPAQKEKIMKGLAMQGLPIPKPRTASEKKLAEKVRAELGLPPEPKTPSEQRKYEDAVAAGKVVTLEGKSPSEKARILKSQAKMGIKLPEGRTPSEKALIDLIKAETKPSKIRIPSEKIRKAKEAGLLTPLEGKTPAQKEKIMKGLAMEGLPIPEPRTASERKLATKVRADLGLPPEPKTPSERRKYEEAVATGKIVPLEGKSPSEKARILKSQAKMGIKLPEGRTPSEKALIDQIKAETKPSKIRIPSEKIRKAKEAGLLTPLEGKTPAQKEKIMKGLAMEGLPIPEPRTASERKLAAKVRADLGLPPEPKTPSERRKYEEAVATGKIVPLEGKSHSEKARILKSQARLGVPLPEGRTASEKALIEQIKAEEKPSKVRIPSEKIREAKAAGLLTPLTGKTPEQQERILKGLATAGLPLPEPKTASEKKLIDKVRTELGLPPEPRTPSERRKYEEAVAAGVIVPLEGKTPAEKKQILQSQAERGIPLPEGRTASEKALIEKVKTEVRVLPKVRIPSEKLRKAKAAGLFTPIEGKLPKQKEKILKGLAMQGLPLPEGKTASEKKIIEKVRADLGLPPEPKTASQKLKYDQAIAAGVIEPLEGKTHSEKAKILKAQAEMGLPLPEGRTPSEKALIAKIKSEVKPITPSEKLRKAKSPSEKERVLKEIAKTGMPLPVGKTPSEKALISKVEEEVAKRPPSRAGAPALPPEKARKLDEKTAKVMKEGKGPVDECICDLLTPEAERETKKPTKIPSEKLRKAKAAGLLTPLEGKKPEQKEKIMRGLAMAGLPIPEPKTASERKLAEKIRADLGLPPEPKTASERRMYEEAVSAGIVVPLEGKTAAEKEKALRAQAEMGLPLPEGRTASEKAIIAKVKAESKVPSKVRIPSEKIRKAKAAGLLTPLEGKTTSEKEKILRGLAMQGLPLPEGKSKSEKKLVEKVRRDLGLPPEPKTQSERKRYEKAIASGVIMPLEKLSPEMKEKTLRAQAELGLPLPEGRTASEKALISKVMAESKRPSKIPSEKLRKAKAAGLITPLKGKSASEKVRILRGLAEAGMPLPEGTTESEKSLIYKIRTEHGIPPPARTASEKELIREAKAEGLFTPLAGKTTSQKERIIKGLVAKGLPLPEGKTISEKELVRKIRTGAGLPPEATRSERRELIKTKSKRVGVGAMRRASRGIGVGRVRSKVEGITEEFEDIVKSTTCDRGCGCDRKKIRFKHSYVKIKVTSPDISSLCPCPDECIPGVKGGIITDNEGIKVTIGSAVGVPSFLNEYELYCHSQEQLIFEFGYDNKPAESITPTIKNPKTSKQHKHTIEYIFQYNTMYTSSEESLEFDNTDSRNNNRLTDESDTKLNAICVDQQVNKINSDLLSASLCSKPYSDCSFDTLLIMKSEPSLCLTTPTCSVISVLSIIDSDCVSESRDYLCYSVSEDSYTDNVVEELEYFTELDCKTSPRNDYHHNKTDIEPRNSKKTGFQILRMSQTELNTSEGRDENNNTNKIEPIIILKDIHSDHDINTVMEELFSSKEFSGTSSLYVVMPSADDSDDTPLSITSDSALSFRMSANNIEISTSILLKNRISSIACALKLSKTPKNNLFESFAAPNYKHEVLKNNSPEKSTRKYTPNINNTQELFPKKQPAVPEIHQKTKPFTVLPQVIHKNEASQAGDEYQMEKHGINHGIIRKARDNTLNRLIQIVGKRKAQTSQHIATNIMVPPTIKTSTTDTRVCMTDTSLQCVAWIDLYATSTSRANKAPAISTDTTADRPCCCAPDKPGNVKVLALTDYSPTSHCVATAVSEMNTPMIESQAQSQGIAMPELNLTTQTSFAKRTLNAPPTPIVTCHIPPCVQSLNDDRRDQQLPTCRPSRVKFASSLLRPEQACMECGGSNELATGKPPNILEPKVNKSEFKANTPDPKVDKIKSIGNKKKVKLKSPAGDEDHRILCPNITNAPNVTNIIPVGKPETKCVACQCCRCADAQTSTEQPAGKDASVNPEKPQVEPPKCACEKKSGKRKVICECPPAPEPESDYDDYDRYYDYIAYADYDEDSKNKWKMQSELTQTTSGFTMNLKKKPVQTEMSFEDALEYYASIESEMAALSEANRTGTGGKRTGLGLGNIGPDCACDDGRKKKSSADCDCPEVPEPLYTSEEEAPLKGLKLTIGGKGSASKGLTGICCFDMYEESNTYMVAYTDDKDSASERYYRLRS